MSDMVHKQTNLILNCPVPHVCGCGFRDLTGSSIVGLFTVILGCTGLMKDQLGKTEDIGGGSEHYNSGGAKRKMGKKPQNTAVKDVRERVTIEFNAPKHTATYAAYGRSEEHVSPEIEIVQSSFEKVVFDLKGVDPAFANALRRVLISEVPAVAIENVYIVNNTSVMADEVLSHRLGLVPIMFDPERLEWKEGDEATEANTLVFSLDSDTFSSEADKQGVINVYSRHLRWEPKGNQAVTFAENPPHPAFDDILLLKMKTNQVLKLEAHAQIGVGGDHIKFSPVAPASYRLLPEIRLMEEFRGEAAKALVKTCPMGVFDIEDDRAVVRNPRSCTMCRECIREPDMAEKIKVLRVKDHFIFTIETVGALPAPILFKRALAVLRAKMELLKESVEELKA